jgi:hypothetical protein
LVLGIYFFLLLSGDGERAGWNSFLRGNSIEDVGNNYDVGTVLMTGRPLFSDGDIKVEMVSLLWNNFLWSLLHFLWLDLATTKD